TRRIGVWLVATILVAFGMLIHADGQATRKGSARNPKYEESTISSVPSTARSTRRLAFDQAASRNEALQSELSWFFGGKWQRGWYLYTPLISSMIGAEDQPSSPRFALKLFGWQGANG